MFPSVFFCNFGKNKEVGQPTRKIIKETYNVSDKKPFYTLLVDGGNLLFQCMRDTKTNSKGAHYGGIFQFFLQIKLLMRDYQYDYVYVVFDDSDSGILRYLLYNPYKANRDKHYADNIVNGEETEYWKKYNATLKRIQRAIYSKEKKAKEKTSTEKFIDENFDRERGIIMEYCDELYIRTLFDDKTEGDDFIAYYVNNKLPEEKIVIVSTDQDLTQLISPTVSVYNRQLKKYLHAGNFQKVKGFPVENVLLKKIFCGDASDNIGNIKGLSESRLMEMMPEIAERPVTVEEVKERAKLLVEERISQKKKPLQWQENIVNGISNKEYDGDFYEINEKIINLKKPLLTDEAKEMIDNYMYAPMDPNGRSFENLYKLITRDGIENLIESEAFARFFEPFKSLADREIRKFKESLK